MAIDIVPSRLQIVSSYSESYRLILGNFRFLLREGGGWMALVIVGWSAIGVLMRAAGYDVFEEHSIWPGEVFMLSGEAVLATGLSIFAVRWHRHVLHAAPADRATARRLAMHYAATVFLIAVVIQLVNGVVQQSQVGSGGGIRNLVISVVALAVNYVACRLSLALPAIALGRTGNLAAAWRNSEGNGWRLVLSSAMISLPMMFLSGVCMMVVAALAPVGGSGTSSSLALGQYIGALAVASTLLMLFVPPALSFLSVAYRELVLKHETQAV